jgi:SAM-dependent methyltransferase
MALPFADGRFDAAVMALVIFFVPEPAKGVAEMARVVRSGGVIATYAWDLLGGGFPLEPIQAELRGMGINPVLPPSAPHRGLKLCALCGRARVSRQSKRERFPCSERSRISTSSGQSPSWPRACAQRPPPCHRRIWNGSRRACTLGSRRMRPGASPTRRAPMQSRAASSN